MSGNYVLPHPPPLNWSSDRPPPPRRHSRVQFCSWRFPTGWGTCCWLSYSRQLDWTVPDTVDGWTDGCAHRGFRSDVRLQLRRLGCGADTSKRTAIDIHFSPTTTTTTTTTTTAPPPWGS